MDSEKGTEEKVHCKRNENLICEAEDSKAGILKKWECRAEEKEESGKSLVSSNFDKD